MFRSSVEMLALRLSLMDISSCHINDEKKHSQVGIESPLIRLYVVDFIVLVWLIRNMASEATCF